METYLQKENFSCWPCSILNWMNYLNINHDLDEYKLIQSINAKPIVWCENEDLIKFLKKEKSIKLWKIKENSKIEDIKKEIDKWNVVLVNYYNAFWPWWHYSIIYKYDNNTNSLLFIDSSLWNLRLSFDIFNKWWHNSKWDIKWFMVSFWGK